MAKYVISAWHAMSDDFRETDNAFEVDGLVAELTETYHVSSITVTRNGQQIPLERVPDVAWMETAA